MRDLLGRSAVVTGGGSGIGAGTVHALAEAGMNVAVVDVNEESAQRVVADVRRGGGHAIALQCDVTDRRAVDEMLDAAFGEFGEVHVLHNNAGVCFVSPFENMSDEEWRLTLDVNINGVVNGLRSFLPRIRRQGGEGHIVNTASMGGLVATPDLCAYTATKYAVVAISETLRLELAPHGIGVSALCPGGVLTNLMETSTSLAGVAPVPSIAMRATKEQLVLDPMEVGRIVRAAIEANDPYILTHPGSKPAVETRFNSILEAFDFAADRAAPQTGR